jgi:hypothetical protein
VAATGMTTPFTPSWGTWKDATY